MFNLLNIRLCKNAVVLRTYNRPFSHTTWLRNQNMHEIHFKMTPYQVLNVPDTQDFDAATAKKNYYKLCKTYHPDTSVNKEEANEKFLMVKEAYSILKDPAKKKGYDMYGSGWKYETPGVNKPSGYNSMYADEAASRQMDEETFWEYMNAATYAERARFNNRSYGNKYTYTSDPYTYNPTTMLPGVRMTKWELVLWMALVTYALYIFVFVGTYNFLFAEDLEAFTKETDLQSIIRLHLMNAYNNYDPLYSDAWSRIRRFLFQRSYDIYKHTENPDDLQKMKLQDPNELKDSDDKSVVLRKKIIEEINYNQELLEKLKDDDIKVEDVNKHINRSVKK